MGLPVEDSVGISLRRLPFQALAMRYGAGFLNLEDYDIVWSRVGRCAV